MLYNSKMNSPCYFPPILGNGDISLAPDSEGGLNYTAEQYENIGIKAFDGIIVRSGRRSNNNSSTNTSRLFSFGKFKFIEGSEIIEWNQNLIEDKGCIESRCVYKDNSIITTNCFVHPDYNIYIINKRFDKIENKKKLYYDFLLEGYNAPMKELTNILYTKMGSDETNIGFKMYGMDIYTGEVRICMDTKHTVEEIENGVRIGFEASTGDSITLFYYLEDNLDEIDYISVLREVKDKINNSGYNGLLRECENDYKAYFDLGYVKTSDKKLNDIYKTCLYALKCYTTKYSIPVGLNNGHWDGRFFAFDEYYSFRGLLTANRIELAKRVPAFRRDICLDKAISLASDCHKNEHTEEMAKFLWETGEKSDVELAPLGPWIDHVFHIPVVGIGAYEYYEYTKDIEFLQHCYRMIRACAKYFTKHMLYHDDDRMYIGKCADLERLGSSVENPFMTACGAIKLLECCADASEILGIDEEYREECRIVSAKLRESLPVENDMYVPFLGCEQKSVAVFAGKFPFDVIDENDPKLIRAWEDFEINGEKYGNMYPMGRGISPWYACWKAEGYARLKMSDKAYEALIESYKSAGVFNEMFEINEEKVRLRPWFTTACGMFISSVNEMLLQSDEHTINILPAFPIYNGNISFKLSVKGGAIAEVKISDDILQSIIITSQGRDITDKYKIFYRCKEQ